MHVAGLGIDGRNNPVRGHFPGDLPRPVLVLLDVLARHQGQQAQSGGGVGLAGALFEGGQHGEGVAHQSVDQGRLGHRVVPGDEGFARRLVVMGTDGDVGGPGDDPAHPADGGDQLGDGVLGGHGVVQESGVEGPAGLALQDAGGVDDRAHGVEDPLGVLGRPQSSPPVGEDRVVEALVVEGQPTGHLPANAVTQRPGRVAIG